MSHLNLKTCRKFSLAAVFMLFFQFIQAQDFEEVGNWLEKQSKMYGGAASTVIYHNNKVVYQKNIGEFNEKTPVPLGQLTQLPTAIMISKLVEEGLLEWDEPLGNKIPFLTKYFKGYITPFHGLAHLTGVEKNYGDAGKIADRKKAINLDEAINVLATLEMSNNTGKEYYFGTIGPYFPARAAEVATKKAYDRLMQEKVARPLKMRFTKFDHELGYAPNPSTGGRGASIDYIQLLAMLLNNGKAEDKTILGEESLKKILTPSAPSITRKYQPAYARNWAYCLGIFEIEPGVYALGSETGSWVFIDQNKKLAAVLFIEKQQKTALPELFNQWMNKIYGQL